MSDDFQVLRETAAESAVWRAGDALISAITRAWQHSSFRAGLRQARSTLASWTVCDRVRGAATAIAVAGLVNVALLWTSNPYSAPGIPRSVIGVLAAFATVIALRPEPFIDAWSTSLLGRISASMRRLFYKPAE